MSFKISAQQRTILLIILALFTLLLMLYIKPASGDYIFAGPDYITPKAFGAGLKLMV